MMNQAPRGFLSWLRLGAALPLFAGLLVAFGATARTISSDPQGPDQAQSVQNDPNTISILVSANDSKNVTVDGQTVAIADLAAYIQNLGFDAPVTANLQADPNVKLGVVEDVKQQLRQTRALKLNYRLPGQTEEVPRRLAPAAGSKTASGLTVLSDTEALQRIDRENIFVVRVNSADGVYAGSGVPKSDQDLLNRVKEFISERGSKAVISFGADRGSSYSRYLSLQALLVQAYDELRDEQAHSRFGKAFADLDDAERSAIYDVLPIRISEAELRNRPQPTKR